MSGSKDQPSEAPYPGSRQIPRWKTGQLPDAPRFTWRNWIGLLGPGLLMAGANIGGGEWLMGPVITAKFGPGLLWLATMSIAGQAVYNIEISRYTLYTGEPIFTGKFRTLPGPMFWVWIYILLDVGMLFPYLAVNAAIPLVALYRGTIPDPDADEALLRVVAIVVFLLTLIPLVIGGKIYNCLKVIMTIKMLIVLGFLVLVAVLFSHSQTWKEISVGLVQIGNVPVTRGEDLNGNGVLDPGEDWDRDGRLDVVEADTDGDGKLSAAEDLDGDGTRDGASVDNVFVSLFEGRGFPAIDFAMIGFLAALAAIAGGGGLGNTPISNYTRDQGWGMGAHVGAIPSIIGGHTLKVSHVGMVFQVSKATMERWRGWYRHVARDQLVIWLPACILGIALPSMLSVAFLKRGFAADDNWLAAVITADALRDHVGSEWGYFFWWMTIFCGFLVLGPSISVAADAFIRRWVDVFWTASRRLRELDPQSIRYVYFAVLSVYAVVSVALLIFGLPDQLLLIAALFLNFALGFSCWHTLWINCSLLPPPLRPGWFIRVALFLAGLFFFMIGTVSTLARLEIV